MLTGKLDDYYISMLGEVQLRYAQYNKPEGFRGPLVAYQNGVPVACGCWKEIDDTTAEVKRIYVEPEARRQGIASAIIAALERDLAAHGKHHVILETARITPDSEKLYLKLGYTVRGYYGSPAGADNCLCFEKTI